MKISVAELDRESRKRIERALPQVPAVELLVAADAVRPEDVDVVLLPFDERPLRGGGRWVVAVVASSSAAEDAFERGADDVLLQPLTLEETRARLSFAVRQARRPRPSTPRRVLAEALEHPRGGEVVIRSGEAITRIHVHEGRVAWVHRAGEPTNLSEVFPDLDPTEAEEVLRIARETRRHFAEVTVDRGRLAPEAVREAVRRFVEARLAPALDAEGATALFLPGARTYDARLSFERREVTRPTLVPATTTRSEVTEALDRSAWLPVVAALRASGAASVAILDGATGRAELEDGDDIDASIAWSLARVISLADAPAGSDVLLGGARVHAARALPGSDRFVAYVAYDDPSVNLALARHQLARALATLT